MLKMIDKSEVPDCYVKEKSPIRLFSKKTIEEFLAMSPKPGDVAEVTGAPVNMDSGGVQKLASSLRNELYYMKRDADMNQEVRVITRGGSRVFLERK